MDKDKRKNIELNIAIALGVILLCVIVIIFRQGKREPASVTEKAEAKKETPLAGALPPLQKIEATEEPQRQEAPKEPAEAEKEEPEEEVTTLKDLPLDSISKEEMREEKTLEEANPLKTRPSYEDMKALQKKNLIIY